MSNNSLGWHHGFEKIIPDYVGQTNEERAVDSPLDLPWSIFSVPTLLEKYWKSDAPLERKIAASLANSVRKSLILDEDRGQVVKVISSIQDRKDYTGFPALLGLLQTLDAGPLVLSFYSNPG